MSNTYVDWEFAKTTGRTLVPAGPAVSAEEAALGASARAVDAQELGELAMSALDDVPSDLHGSAGYRRRVGAAVVAAAWDAASREALGG